MFTLRSPVVDFVLFCCVITLSLIFLRSEYTAPQVTPASRLQAPHEVGFPTWFGKGATPHDARLPPIEHLNGIAKVLVIYGE